MAHGLNIKLRSIWVTMFIFKVFLFPAAVTEMFLTFKMVHIPFDQSRHLLAFKHTGLKATNTSV